ncbi:MAG: phytanoyl-CoA dioxygenase family protein [Gammaproteobacteria bacterium]
MSSRKQSAQYEYEGFAYFPKLYSDAELNGVGDVLERFHTAWLDSNAEVYKDGAINSAYLTDSQYLNDEDRLQLFKFIGSHKISSVLGAVLASEVMFVGSQLFFDPADMQQQNYWHRDIQYNDMTEEQQRAAMLVSNNLHLRIALKSERGVGLVPGTHRRWDDGHEYDVRMERNGQQAHSDLPNGIEVEMERGDVLVFSANMIHRGLYGNDRRSLDLLFGGADPETARFVKEEALPNAEQLSQLEWPSPFNIAREITSELKSGSALT